MSLTRLQSYTLDYLSGLPVAGPDGLRAFIRREVEAGHLTGLSGTHIVTMSKSACIAALLGEEPAEAQPPFALSGGIVPPASEGASMPPDAAALLLKAFAMLSAGALDENKVRNIALEETNRALNNGALTSALGNRIEQAISGLADELWKRRPLEIIVTSLTGEHIQILGRQHFAFKRLLAHLKVKNHVWLVGPAGSGKTTAAKAASKALGLPFHFNGAIDSEHKLLGFVDAMGKIVCRPFREAWEKGGVYLFDEVDASMPAALLAFNAALANGTCDFPDGAIEAHKDFRCIAAGNVWNGATAEYVGRMKQDLAFLDRFQTVAWGYDEKLGTEITASIAKGMAVEMGTCPIAAVAIADEWSAYVQRARAKAKEHGLKVVISPRASFAGVKLLMAGDLTREEIVEDTLRKGMAEEMWARITEA